MEAIEIAASRLKTLRRATVSVPFRSAGEVGTAHKRVVWAETNLHSVMAWVLDWDALGEELSELRPALASLQEAMREPPADSGRDYTGTVRSVNLPAMRNVAQSLQGIVMYDLHRGDLPSAHQEFLMLVGMARLHSESWTIVDQMVRSAIANLATDAVWNALQAPGWTDHQLSELQNRLSSLSFFNELEKSYQAERAVGLYLYFDMKTNRNKGTLGMLNPQPSLPDLPSQALEFVWESLWADTDLLFYCRHHQALMDSLHALAATRSYRQIASGLAEARTRLERARSGVRSYRYLWSAMALSSTERAPETLVKNETLRQLAITGIALKRYELRHGKPPGALTDLQPEFLRDLPVDFYDGRSLRYRLDADGSSTLYSVGANFRDDGGDGSLDLVWPKPIWPQNVAK